MNYYGKTDIGKRRENNQDCLGAKTLECGITVLAVCDGMGGVKGGEIASSLALDTFLGACERDLKPYMEDGQIRGVLTAAVHEANTAVFRKGNACEELSGMGTTLVAALILHGLDYMFIVNVGDSRAYSVCGDSITQLSFDHSYVQFLVDKGDITPAEAATHPDRHVITRAVGVADAVRPDIDRIDIERKGDAPYYLLLCSDGLTGMISNDEILKHVNSATSPDDRMDSLIGAANEAGGDDNITVLIAEL